MEAGLTQTHLETNGVTYTARSQKCVWRRLDRIGIGGILVSLWGQNPGEWGTGGSTKTIVVLSPIKDTSMRHSEGLLMNRVVVISYYINMKMTLKLSETKLGRFILHTICACRDHHWAWHYKCVTREFHKAH